MIFKKGVDIIATKKLLSLLAEKMATDEAFAEKVSSMQTAQSFVELAQNEGFTITEQQAKAGLAKIKSLADKGKTLNDEELDDIAGAWQCGCEDGYAMDRKITC